MFMFHTFKEYIITWVYLKSRFITQLKSHTYIQRKQQNQDVRKLVLTECQNTFILHITALWVGILYYVMICLISLHIELANIASFRYTRNQY
jgi:hypothetical protein